MRYLVRLAYNGTLYHGWQIQPNAKTIQEELELCLSKLQGQKIGLVGCGRTDTGVHASDYYAHFDTLNQRYNDQKLRFKLNSMLSDSISIKEIHPVSNDFHARFSAVSRKYEYVICKIKDPFSKKQALFFQKELDTDKMLEAGKMLLEYEDFTSFAKLHTDVKTNICDVMEFGIAEDSERMVITIKANRFLRNMVRAIVGTLIEVGLHKLSIKEFKEIIEAKDRREASFSAPAEGLFLCEILYPEELMKPIEVK